MKLRKNNLMTILTTALVFVALIAISLFQYRWLISSAEKDLSEMYRGVTFRMYKTLAYEVEKELYSLNDVFITPNSEIDVIKSTIEESLTDYIDIITFSLDREFSYTYDGKSWEDGRLIPLSPGEMGQLIPDKTNTGLVKFILPIRDNGVVYVYFNLLKLYNENIYLKDNFLKEGFELNWHFTLPKNSHLINERMYRFSPLKTIKNTIFLNDSLYLFRIGFHVDLQPKRDQRGLKFYLKPKQNSEVRDSDIYLDILYNGEPMVLSKERHITMQWLFTLGLLFGLGIAYFLILNQIHKLKKIREKEKIFVASVTHELRTPLTVIHSAADNIKSGIISKERQVEYGELISEHSSRLSKMVEGILLFSRLEGKSEKVPQLKPLKSEDIIDYLKTINSDLDIRIPEHISFLSDRDSLILILSNLVTNAIKYAKESRVRVYAHIKLPSNVVFIVEDDGPGINKRDQKNIFEPFFRCERSYVEQIKGSGLGLFLAYKKAKLLGGNLKVQSSYQRVDGIKRSGARFILSIPYHKIDKGGIH